mmetsp:Transcript_8622/g.11378  ORF Transcript_8622/g.11378 Transcript_8622/m.11378 type:complete len:249 (-) Transcript_8622:320-1066(-)
MEKNSTGLILGLFTESCFQTYFTEGDLFNQECGIQVLSKVLGYLILLGSLMVKVPQILKIVQSKSADGLSAASFYTEVVLFIFSVVYNVQMKFPISSYGEAISILVQNIILVFAIWAYIDPPVSLGHKLSVGTGILLITAIALVLPPHLRHLLILSNLPMMVIARVPQIVMNYKNGHTGQLAFVTCMLNAAGSLVRIMTTMVESGGDIPLLVSFLISALLNGITFIQVLWYWKATAEQAEKIMEKKAK